jgi:hypothetical protein
MFMNTSLKATKNQFDASVLTGLLRGACACVLLTPKSLERRIVDFERRETVLTATIARLECVPSHSKRLIVVGSSFTLH